MEVVCVGFVQSCVDCVELYGTHIYLFRVEWRLCGGCVELCRDIVEIVSNLCGHVWTCVEVC